MYKYLKMVFFRGTLTVVGAWDYRNVIDIIFSNIKKKLKEQIFQYVER